MPTLPPPPPSPSPSGARPEDASPKTGSVFLGAGTLVGAAALASLVASVPAAIRIAGADAGSSTSGVAVWAALASVALLPAIAIVAAMRGARVGLRAFGGEGASARAIGFGLWLGLTFLLLAAYGTVLRATTHHHALAGVTFALGALGISVATAVTVRRFVAVAQKKAPGTRAVMMLGSSAALCAALAAAAVPLSHAILPQTSALLLDLLALGIAAGFASRPVFAGKRPLALIGPPVAAAIFVFGASVLRTSPPLFEAIRDRAPLFATATDLRGD